MTTQRAALALILSFVLCDAPQLAAHDGPPYPIVSNHIAGAYDVSVWSDPDSTSDGSAGGKFWIILATRDSTTIPSTTHVRVEVQPVDRPGEVRHGRAEPVEGAAARQFAALVLDHEGQYRVRVGIDGPLGLAELEAFVEATDDLRPAPYLLAVYAFPFLALGVLWARVLLRRRRPVRPPTSSRRPPHGGSTSPF